MTNPKHETEQDSLIEAFLGDGSPLLSLFGIFLILCGGFALFQSATGNFLPHDVEWLGMTARELCSLHGCRVVHFMFHDRVAFGGTLIALGVLYFWLAVFPLKRGEAWAWWLFLVSGIAGFLTFLAYLGYGYLDIWHGAATLGLLPLFAVGIFRARRLVSRVGGISSLFRPSQPLLSMPLNWGRLILLTMSAGLVGAGLTIVSIGMTTVFVPQDLAFMGLRVEDLRAVNSRLVPLIAHDRAGFGGTLFTVGLTMFFCLWCGKPSRSLWQAVAASGFSGFGAAISIHLIIGYTDVSHLAPAVTGLALFVIGIILSHRAMVKSG